MLTSNAVYLHTLSLLVLLETLCVWWGFCTQNTYSLYFLIITNSLISLLPYPWLKNETSMFYVLIHTHTCSPFTHTHPPLTCTIWKNIYWAAADLKAQARICGHMKTKRKALEELVKSSEEQCCCWWWWYMVVGGCSHGNRAVSTSVRIMRCPLPLESCGLLTSDGHDSMH